MTIKITLPMLCAVLWLVSAAAQAEDKLDYTELSRLIHQGVVGQVPKNFEDFADWGKTIPITNDVRFPRLQRTRVKVGEREEFPHGLWKRTKVWMDHPAKDLHIQVRDFKAVDGQTFRLGVDVTVAIHGEREWKPWQKGLALPGVTVQADARIQLVMDCDVQVAFDFAKLPPDIKINPRVVKSQVNLQDFELRRIGNNLLTIEGDGLRDLSLELKSALQQYIRSQETQVKEQLNLALAKNVKDGKGSFSGDNLMKLLGTGQPK